MSRKTRAGTAVLVSVLTALAVGETASSCSSQSEERSNQASERSASGSTSTTALKAVKEIEFKTTRDAQPPIVLPALAPLPTRPRHLPQPPQPEVVPTAALVDLGAMLFSSPNLGMAPAQGSQPLSCSSCHVPEHKYADNTSLATTAAGKKNLRHTPSLLDLAFAKTYYWDGRGTSLVETIRYHAMGQLGIDLDEAASKLNPDPLWRARMTRTSQGGSALSGELLTKALASFVLTRYSPSSAWDRYESGIRDAVSQSAIRGAIVFTQRAGCAGCHLPPLYTDHKFHMSATNSAGAPPDVGRTRITGKAADMRAFRTPSLRAMTAPYFHAGTHARLEIAVAVELGRIDAQLNAIETTDLLAFLHALSL